MKHAFSRQIFEKHSLSNLMKIHPAGAESFLADRRKTNDEANFVESSWVPRPLSLGVQRPVCEAVRLTTQLHLVPRLGMSGALTPPLMPLWRVQCQLYFSRFFVKGKLPFSVGTASFWRSGRWDAKYKQRRTVYLQSGREDTWDSVYDIFRWHWCWLASLWHSMYQRSGEI
jgi:hypothetical protein